MKHVHGMVWFSVCFICLSGLVCARAPLDATVTIDTEGASLGEILSLIRSQVEISYVGPDELLHHADMLLSVHVKDAPVEDVIRAAAQASWAECDILESGMIVLAWPSEEQEDEEAAWEFLDDLEPGEVEQILRDHFARQEHAQHDKP